MTANHEVLPVFPMARTSPLDPPPELLRLQQTEPVARVRLRNGQAAWLLTRYEDIKNVLTSRDFSADIRTPGYPIVQESVAIFGEGRLNHLDPPEHDVYRRMLAPEFMVKRTEALRPVVTELVHALIDTMIDAGSTCDLVTALAIPVPATMICALLGVPYSDRDFFVRCVETSLGGTASLEEAAAAAAELRAYFVALVADKASGSHDDLLSRVHAEHVRTGALAESELVGFAELLLTAGFDTTWNMIALGTLTLLMHPDQAAALRADPSLAAPAVEELLRFLTVPHLGRHRVALRDVAIGDVPIEAGDGVIAAANAANRDPSAFEAPNRFDIRRNVRHHLGFGHGIHQCIAASLARVELQEVYPILLQRLPALELAAPIDSLRFKHGSAVYGVEQLPVAWQ